LISLLDNTANAKSKLSLYLSPKYNAFALFASRKKTNHISRMKKEVTRKAGNRKRKRDESAVQSLMLKVVDEFTFKALMAISLPRTASVPYVTKKSISMH